MLEEFNGFGWMKMTLPGITIGYLGNMLIAFSLSHNEVLVIIRL